MRRLFGLLCIYAGLAGVGWYFFSHDLMHIIIGIVFIFIGGLMVIYSPHRPMYRTHRHGNNFWLYGADILEFPFYLVLWLVKALKGFIH